MRVPKKVASLPWRQSTRLFTTTSRARRTQLLPEHTTHVLPRPFPELAAERGPIPAFRVVDSHGKLEDERMDLGRMAEREFARRCYETMLGLPQLDIIMSNVQRQGRISFYMTCFGEEAAVVCSAAAWQDTDEIFGQYREQGVLLWRGFTLDDFAAQCFGTASDTSSLGRQMPVHYASPSLHFQAISSPLATQLPQAAGAAYALKRRRERGLDGEGERGRCVVTYCGEGAASEGDFHAAMNMASVLGGPLIFFVRNNGFAISTPASQQYAGDGIAARAAGYGMDFIRVDGNDPVAVYLASVEARRRASEGEGKPVMVEALTYRVGHHSTSDDSSAYRSKGEVEHWKLADNPLHRMRQYLADRGWWSDADEDSTKKAWRDGVSAAVRKAEKAKKPSLASMWDDTFAVRDARIERQKRESDAVIKKWGALYKDELAKHVAS